MSAPDARRGIRSPARRVLVAALISLAASAFTEGARRALGGGSLLAEGLLIGVVAAAAVFSAARWGLPAGLGSGIVALAYSPVYFTTAQALPLAKDPPLAAAMGAGVGLLILALAALAGALKSRADQAAERALEAERRHSRGLERMNRDLQTANRVLQDFTHVVSHDLKEPARAMSVLHRILEEDHAASLDEDGRELLRRLRAADARLGGLLEALLEYSRASRFDANDLRFARVRDVLTSDECRARYQDLLAERGGRIVPPDADAPPVLTNPGALALVLGNLVTNALKHNPRPDPLVRVRVDAEPGSANARIAVEDNGPGFSRDTFERFRRDVAGDEPHAALGVSGFGLLMVERAVARLGGRMSLGTSPEGGAAVAVTLPRASGEPPPRHERTSAESGGRAAPRAEPPPPSESAERRGGDTSGWRARRAAAS